MKIKSRGSARWDAIALGAMTRRNDPGEEPVHTASEFKVYCSGAEYNPIAALSACFRQRTAMVTANVEYPLGWWVEGEVRKMGVEGIYRWFPFDGLGLPCISKTYSDRPRGVRAPEVWYERRGEAAALLEPQDFDWQDIFERKGARWLHSGGLFAALSPGTSELLIHALQAAKASGTVCSFDINWRSKIWKASTGGAERARDVYRRIMPHIDAAFGNEEDFQNALGIAGPAIGDHAGADAVDLDIDKFKSMIEKVLSEFPNLKVVATTLRQVHSAGRHSWRAVMWFDGKFYVTDSVDLEVLDRIGGGDGFAAGLIYGFLSGADPQRILDLGWAHGALLTTTTGDVSKVRLDQVESFGGSRVDR